MPLTYTKEEITEYLKARGFDTNDEALIKKFIHDLKKLVKFEDRQRRRVKLGHDPQDTNLESTAASDNPSSNHIAGTSTPKKSKDKDRKSKESGNEESIDVEKPDVDVEEVTDDQGEPESKKPSETLSEKNMKPHFAGPSTTKSKWRPTTAKNVTDGKKKTGIGGDESRRLKSAPNPRGHDKENDGNRDETSEILYILGNILGEKDGASSSSSDSLDDGRSRLRLGPSQAVKKDPVALYYYYKKFWDKQNFPGDNRHMKLRWNVRAQTVGNYPCIDGQPVKYLR